MKRVLIVDDDLDLLEMVCLMVETSNMSPLCVDNGDAALEALTQEPFDLILMDIYLGEYDGRALARQLKATENYKHIPILLYSAGNITRDSLEQSLADGFLQKPFDMPVLLNRMREMMIA